MALTMNDIYEILRNEGGRTPSEKVMEVSKDHPEKIAMRYKEFGICLLYTSPSPRDS